MKRLFIASLVLMVCILTHAQLKVFPQMNVGDKYVYDCVTASENPTIKFTAKSTIEFKVSEKTADGYIVDMLMTGLENDSKDNMISALMNMTEGMIKDVKIRVVLDKNGKAQKIVNFNEVKKHCAAYIDRIVSMVYEETPQLEKTTPKAEMLNQAKSTLKESILLDGITKTGTNPISIFGKTFTEGMVDSYVNSSKIKMKRTYHITGNTITCNGVSNMTNEETKEFILKKVEDSMPDKLESIKNSIDMLMESGLMNIEGTEDTVYKLLNNKWPKTINMNVNMKIMGQKITINAQSTLRNF